MSNLYLTPEHVLQGGYHHAALRKLQEPNTSIEPHNIMYPVFLMYVLWTYISVGNK